MLTLLRSRRRILARACLLAAPLLLIFGLLRIGSAERFCPPPPPTPVRASDAPANRRPPYDRSGTAELFRPPSCESPLTPPFPPAPPAIPSHAAPSPADEETLLALIAAAQSDTDPAVRHERHVAICLHWAGFDPPAAITLSGELGLDPLAGQLVANLAQQWAARDFPAAQAWADRLPAGELRDQVYSRLAYEQAGSDPAAAARLLTAMSPASPAHAEATLSVLHASANPPPTGPFTATSRPFPLGLADADVPPSSLSPP